MKYFQQETNYTCGCAAFRMILSNFMKEEDIPVEKYLESKLSTNTDIGTHWDSIVKLAKDEYNLEVILKQDSSIQELEELTKDGYKIMLAISVDVPHWVVYSHNNGNHIYFHDPYFGDNTVREIKNFISDKQNYPFYRWKIKSSEFKKYFPEYDFSSIESNKLIIAFKNKL